MWRLDLGAWSHRVLAVGGWEARAPGSRLASPCTAQCQSPEHVCDFEYDLVLYYYKVELLKYDLHGF